jgi:hypothetical protein
VQQVQPTDVMYEVILMFDVKFKRRMLTMHARLTARVQQTTLILYLEHTDEYCK